MSTTRVSIVVAYDNNRGIGLNNGLPWSLPAESAFFRCLTTSTLEGAPPNAVIMGRNTWNSIPKTLRPLKGRTNVVITSKPYLVATEHSYGSFSGAVTAYANMDNPPSYIYAIGGQGVYEAALKDKRCDTIYATEIDGSFMCDTFFPEVSKDEWVLDKATDPQTERGVTYKFTVYRRG